MASFLYPKSSLHFSSQKIVPIVGCVEVRSASGKAGLMRFLTSAHPTVIA